MTSLFSQRFLPTAVVAALALAAGLLSGCAKKPILIYTSLSKDVIAEMDPILRLAVPKAEVRWFQGGSDNIASKLSAEFETEEDSADLVMTSDPLWFLEAKQKGKLLPYNSPAITDVPARYRDPDNAFTAVRIPVIVLGYNSELLKPNELPERWRDLSNKKWKNKISMGSPLDTGTAFTAVALLAKLLGWEYFAELRRQNLFATGGNNAVLNRIATRERPVGILLLETILKARARKSPVSQIYPLDGVIPVPGFVAILRTSRHKEMARQVHDWFFSPAAQTAIIHGGMYSPLPKIASPDLARPWPELQSQLLKWSPELLAELLKTRDQVRGKFSEVVLH